MPQLKRREDAQGQTDRSSSTSERQLPAGFHEAVQRVCVAPDDFSHGFRQKGFRTFCAVSRYVAETEICRCMPAFVEFPYSLAREAVSLISETTVHMGAKIYAVLTRDTDTALDSPEILFSELWEAYSQVATDDSELYRAWHSAGEQIGVLWDVLGYAACDVVSTLETLDGAFEAHREALGDLVLERVYRGAVAEFCLTRLMAEQQEDAGIVAKVVGAVTGNEDIADERNIAAFEAAVGLPDTVGPWPTDARCACGKSLKPAIFCCDPARPIDLSKFTDRLQPGFRLAPECCHQSLEGFRCDACGRVYSWSKGVVDSLFNKQLM